MHARLEMFTKVILTSVSNHASTPCQCRSLGTVVVGSQTHLILVQFDKEVSVFVAEVSIIPKEQSTAWPNFR